MNKRERLRYAVANRFRHFHDGGDARAVLWIWDTVRGPLGQIDAALYDWGTDPLTWLTANAIGSTTR